MNRKQRMFIFSVSEKIITGIVRNADLQQWYMPHIILSSIGIHLPTFQVCHESHQQQQQFWQQDLLLSPLESRIPRPSCNPTGRNPWQINQGTLVVMQLVHLGLFGNPLITKCSIKVVKHILCEMCRCPIILKPHLLVYGWGMASRSSGSTLSQGMWGNEIH